MRVIYLALCAVIGLGSASSANSASDGENRERYFQEFCLTPGTVARSVAALQTSNKVGPAEVTDIGGRQYISFTILGVERGSITVINPPSGGLQCSVGIKNIGIDLYEGGRVKR
jgi:hypothetical protein